MARKPWKRILCCSITVFVVLACTLWLSYLVSRPVYAGPDLPARVWIPALALALFLGIAPVAGSLVALLRPRLAVLLLATAAIPAIWSSAVLGSQLSSPFNYDFLARYTASESGVRCAALAMALLGILALLWLVAANQGWLPIERKVTLRWWIGTVILWFTFAAAATTVMDLQIVGYTGCHPFPPPFYQPRNSIQAVFEARIVLSGDAQPLQRDEDPRVPRKRWALAVVRKSYWGLPWSYRGLVILSGFERGDSRIFHRGETYFIDSRRRSGAGTRFMPIFDTFCTHTGNMQDVALELRVMHEGSPSPGIRILGYTYRLDTQYGYHPTAGGKVRIRGTGGEMVVTSDQNGIYDVSGLPPGPYEVSAEPNDANPRPHSPECRLAWDAPAQPEDVRECSVVVERADR